ncbi:hypothetical protein SDC9_100181 [bioreactor metagenome]|uniref:Uncharacterized protein n=1 Tax=bioreactor metagenome TaxID=1076179 RepID=A0A645ARC8_9ZZZZ
MHRLPPLKAAASLNQPLSAVGKSGSARIIECRVIAHIYRVDIRRQRAFKFVKFIGVRRM